MKTAIRFWVMPMADVSQLNGPVLPSQISSEVVSLPVVAVWNREPSAFVDQAWGVYWHTHSLGFTGFEAAWRLTNDVAPSVVLRTKLFETIYHNLETPCSYCSDSWHVYFGLNWLFTWRSRLSLLDFKRRWTSYGPTLFRLQRLWTSPTVVGDKLLIQAKLNLLLRHDNYH